MRSVVNYLHSLVACMRSIIVVHLGKKPIPSSEEDEAPPAKQQRFDPAWLTGERALRSRGKKDASVSSTQVPQRAEENKMWITLYFIVCTSVRCLTHI